MYLYSVLCTVYSVQYGELGRILYSVHCTVNTQAPHTLNTTNHPFTNCISMDIAIHKINVYYIVNV